MRTKILMVAAVALMAMVSCTKEENNPGEPQVTPPSYYIDFTANIPSEDTSKPQLAQDTKTGYDSESGKTKWLEGDEIAVNGKKFAVVELIDGGLSARFENIEELGEFGVDFKEPYTAVYPYNKTLNTTVVPHEQTLTAETFADEAIAAVAYSESERTLSFKHVSTYLRFTVATAGLKELEFTSAGYIAGTITVDANKGGDPTYAVSDGKNTIKAIPASDTFEVGQSYYISVLPTLGSADVKQKLEIKSEGVTVKSGNVRFKRNVPAKLEDLTVNYTYLKPNANWKADGARFAVYFYKTATEYTWSSMTDSDGDGVYRAVVPDGYTKMNFCRMKGDAAANDWANKWDQTNDLTLDSSKCYAVHAGEWSYGAGGWFTIDDAKNLLYLFAGAEWDKDSARFAAYFYGNGETWKSMSSYAGNNFYVVKPTGYPNVIFCRMNGSQAANNWNNKWNQTINLTIPKNGNNTYSITGPWAGGGQGATGEWSAK